MKNVREDVPILDALVGNKLLSYAEAQELARLPLVVILNEPSEETKSKEFLLEDTIWVENPILTEFSVLYNACSSPKYAVFRYEGAFLKSFLFTQVNNSFFILKSANSHVGGMCNLEMTTLVKKGLSLNEAGKERALSHAMHTLVAALEFMKEGHYNDQYAVEVREPKPKTASTRRQQLNKVSGPSIIFLNKLPQPSGRSTATEEPTGTKALHHRRGHFKTLRDERYANHPKYLVERGIYVKPAWIGDRQSIVNGTTYTVLEK